MLFRSLRTSFVLELYAITALALAPPAEEPIFKISRRAFSSLGFRFALKSFLPDNIPSATSIKLPISILDAVLFDFGESALVFRVYFWLSLNGPRSRVMIESDFRTLVDKSFRTHGIAMPFPQRHITMESRKPLEVKIVSNK